MKLAVTLFSILLLSACASTDPVTMKFPNVPDEVMVACPDLEQQAPTEKLSDVLETVSKNYSQYYECKLKVDSWITWYTSQKKIYESVK